MEQSVEAIYLYDAQTKQVLESNEAFRRMMGYSQQELIGREIYDFIDHPIEDIDANVERSLREKRRYIGERRYRCKDGMVIVVDTSASVISYKGKVALCAVSRDVTERKRIEEALKESEERFRSLTQNASDVVAVIRADGITRYVSPSIEHVLGYRPEERMDASSFELIHPDDVARVRRLFAELVASPGGGVTVEFRLQHKDGSWRHVEAIGKNLIDDASIGGVIVTYHDVTERKRAGEVLAEERNLLRTLIDNMPDFIFVKDTESRFVINNTEHARALGAPEEELVGKTDFDVFPRELAERYYADEQEIIHSGRALVDKEEPVVDQEGNHRWLSTTKVPLRDGDGEISGLVGISRDITDRKALEEQLRHRAFHDPLTELPNRALFLDRLGHAMARSGRLREPVAVLFVDLDDFKRVNDSLGHEIGDRLLVEVGERLASSVRAGDTVARLFGDEFAVLLEAPTGVANARRTAERIQECLRSPFAFDEQEVFVGCSIGIVLNDPARRYQPREVLRHADLAMYVAKSRGKSRYEMFNPSMDTRASERMELENQLRRAIERKEFEVRYQPIIELGSSRVAGLEALAHWRHPERGLLAAKEFIQVVEHTGLIRPIGQLVFEEACRQAREWRERHANGEILMCVNFSASQFVYQADLIPKVLSDTGLDPEGLRVEITERAVMDDAEFSIGKLQRLKDLGVSFAIDDYGTGYSCLYYLKRMPVDSLKIDGSFVAGLGKDPGDDAIVSGTIDLAHALGLKVVAEGVETAEQLARLEELGCDLAQGFYLCEPLSVEEALDFLTSEQNW